MTKLGVNASALQGFYTAEGQPGVLGALARAYNAEVMTAWVHDHIVRSLADRFIAEHGKDILANLPEKEIALAVLARVAERIHEGLKR